MDRGKSQRLPSGHYLSSYVDDFLEGFRTAQAEYPPATRSTQTLFVTTVKGAFNSYRPAASQPTAYFCPNPTVGNAIVRSATANGMSVGRDISVVAFDCGSRKHLTGERNSTLTVSRLDIGKLSEALLQSVQPAQKGASPPRHLRVKPELIFGDTIAAAPQCRRLGESTTGDH
ncbi:hypothetical protein A6U87_20880 [Rhizobium sp. AC44/96]|uniref:substrate-binding domain-containing protein n=1 Tax=Rhizobium sp. AC44/96 TaxID=1841654 RepID=UPI00080F7D93|nr:substrate-binding domain-containing protein [Rhizobium sp. AC44/96]OCJ17259.1 hypothetical protein A6U87_20880 [Rhizobium sp. AC44/96]